MEGSLLVRAPPGEGGGELVDLFFCVQSHGGCVDGQDSNRQGWAHLRSSFPEELLVPYGVAVVHAAPGRLHISLGLESDFMRLGTEGVGCAAYVHT